MAYCQKSEKSRMKLLVVYGDEAYCLRLCECLKEMDAFCVEEPLFDASAAIARAKVAMPDIVIADMQLSGMEAMELLDSLRRECGAKTVACSSVHNESAALTAMQHGADYFVAKPIPPDRLAYMVLVNYEPERAAALLQTRRETELAERVSKRLLQLGIMPKMKGFNYLKCALSYICVNAVRGGLTTDVYPYVGEQFGTAPKNVDRCIRHAIEQAWLSGSIEKQHEMFGYTVTATKGKPTNSEFIYTVLEHLKNEADT